MKRAKYVKAFNMMGSPEYPAPFTLGKLYEFNVYSSADLLEGGMTVNETTQYTTINDDGDNHIILEDMFDENFSEIINQNGFKFDCMGIKGNWMDTTMVYCPDGCSLPVSDCLCAQKQCLRSFNKAMTGKVAELEDYDMHLLTECSQCDHMTAKPNLDELKEKAEKDMDAWMALILKFMEVKNVS